LLSTHEIHAELAPFALARQLVAELPPLLLEHAKAASATAPIAAVINMAFIIARRPPLDPSPLDGVRHRHTH
jgi:hypothetical protein